MIDGIDVGGLFQFGLIMAVIAIVSKTNPKSAERQSGERQVVCGRAGHENATVQCEAIKAPQCNMIGFSVKARPEQM